MHKKEHRLEAAFAVDQQCSICYIERHKMLP